MGEALSRAVVNSNKAIVYIYDKDEAKASALAASLGAEKTDFSKIVTECDFLFLAVKPNIIPTVAEQIRDFAGRKQGATVVSMAAGVKLVSLESYLGKDTPIIRIMPNTPAAVGSGVMLVCNNSSLTSDAMQGFKAIMEASGLVDELCEELFDVATAVSGCGPAFAYAFIDAMAAKGEELGLPRDKALLYAADTVIGAAKMVKVGKKTPEELKRDVCSPGGSTIEGVKVLDAGDLKGLVGNAVNASYEKTVILSKS